MLTPPPQPPQPPRRKNRHAQALARLGAAKGGRARWARLTPAERSALARRLAQLRWARVRQAAQTDQDQELTDG